VSNDNIKTAEVPPPQRSGEDHRLQPPVPPATAGTRLATIRDVAVGVGSKSYLFVVALIVLLIGGQLSPHFLSSNNLVAVLITASVVAVLAVGQFFVIVTGGIDLSVGSVAAVASVVGALVMSHGMPFGVAVIAGLALCGLIGLINGMFIVYGGITPFIVTLAMMSIARGFAYLIQTGRLVPIDNSTYLGVFTGNLGPIPAPVLLAALVMLTAMIVMAYRSFGRRLYALGGNPEAARLSGLPVKRDTISAYVLSSTLAGLGGLMIAAQLTEGSAIIGDGYELNAIAAVVVGGASLFGGTGNPVTAVLGGLIIGAILNIMDLLGVGAQAQLVVKGVVILLAVLFTSGAGSRLVPRLFTALFGRPQRRGKKTTESTTPNGAHVST